MCRIKSHPNYNKTVFSSSQWECMTFAKFAKQFLLFFKRRRGAGMAVNWMYAKLLNQHVTNNYCASKLRGYKQTLFNILYKFSVLL